MMVYGNRHDDILDIVHFLRLKMRSVLKNYLSASSGVKWDRDSVLWPAFGRG
jgi:hypothetical protein